MAIRIILSLKNDTEYNSFQKLVNYPERFISSEIQSDFNQWKKENITDAKDDVFLLVHFGNTTYESHLCKELLSWNNEIKMKNVYLIPISSGTDSKKANELYEKVEKDELLNEKELKSIKKYWDYECKKCEKKTLIPLALPFCIYCENAYKFNSFENNEMKIQEELEKIKKGNYKDKFEFPKKIKEKWNEIEGLLDSKGKLKEDEMKKFIGLKEDGSKVPMEETLWLTLLGDLNQWAVNADDQK